MDAKADAWQAAEAANRSKPTQVTAEQEAEAMLRQPKQRTQPGTRNKRHYTKDDKGAVKKPKSSGEGSAAAAAAAGASSSMVGGEDSSPKGSPDGEDRADLGEEDVVPPPADGSDDLGGPGLTPAMAADWDAAYEGLYR